MMKNAERWQKMTKNEEDEEKKISIEKNFTFWMVEFSASEVPHLRLFWGFESWASVFHSMPLLNEPFAAKVKDDERMMKGWWKDDDERKKPKEWIKRTKNNEK